MMRFCRCLSSNEKKSSYSLRELYILLNLVKVFNDLAFLLFVFCLHAICSGMHNLSDNSKSLKYNKERKKEREKERKKRVGTKEKKEREKERIRKEKNKK